MKKQSIKNQKGFTLIETLIAILILALTIGALLTLTAGGFFSIRYAKNDIVAANLLQESLEFIRNTRDNAAQGGLDWNTWIDQYKQCRTDINSDGCIINPYSDAYQGSYSVSDAVVGCSGDCPNLWYFPASGFYGYTGSLNVFDPSNTDTNRYETSFVRTVKMDLVTTTPDPQLIVTARMDWLNGTNRKSTTQSIILTPWNLQ